MKRQHVAAVLQPERNTRAQRRQRKENHVPRRTAAKANAPASLTRILPIAMTPGQWAALDLLTAATSKVEGRALSLAEVAGAVLATGIAQYAKGAEPAPIPACEARTRTMFD